MSEDQPPSTVLYVEDDECDLLFMQRAFRQAGLGDELRSVGNGQEAMDYLNGNGAYADRGHYPVPSLVLLDLNLPLVSGFKVLEWMKTREDLAALPVVVFSSSTRPEDNARAKALGAKDYVAKPASGSRFADVLGRLRETWLS